MIAQKVTNDYAELTHHRYNSSNFNDFSDIWAIEPYYVVSSFEKYSLYGRQRGLDRFAYQMLLSFSFH